MGGTDTFFDGTCFPGLRISGFAAPRLRRYAATSGYDKTVKIVPIDATQLKRVVIIGTSCSGKTTFERSLAQKLKVQHIELDSIHWKPN